jgi:hypothetical protein
MSRQSSPLIVCELVHNVDLYFLFHEVVLGVYRGSFSICLLCFREKVEVGGFEGFPWGACMFSCFFVPFFLYSSNASKSRLLLSCGRDGYVGTILVSCLSADCLT